MIIEIIFGLVTGLLALVGLFSIVKRVCDVVGDCRYALKQTKEINTHNLILRKMGDKMDELERGHEYILSLVNSLTVLKKEDEDES